MDLPICEDVEEDARRRRNLLAVAEDDGRRRWTAAKSAADSFWRRSGQHFSGSSWEAEVAVVLLDGTGTRWWWSATALAELRRVVVVEW